MTAHDSALDTRMHSATVVCRVPAPLALAFLADGLQLGRWALGCWQTEAMGEGLVRGHSLFDGQPVWVRPVADVRQGEVLYHLGDAADALTPRIRATVQPEPGGACRIGLHAQRSPSMDDARWLRLQRCHEVEVLLIDTLLLRLQATQPPEAPLSKPVGDAP